MWKNSEYILFIVGIGMCKSSQYIQYYSNVNLIFLSQVKQVAEDTKFLWGRRDDESCLAKLKDDLNSTSLAEYCGIFSR